MIAKTRVRMTLSRGAKAGVPADFDIIIDSTKEV